MSGTRTGQAAGLARWLWVLGFALSVLVAAWPFLGGERTANDDLQFIRGGEQVDGVAAALADAWCNRHPFRPLEVLVGRTCDPETLGTGIANPLQIAGLIVLLAATASLARKVAPNLPEARPIAILLLLLSPGTTNGLWQVDSVSQTWSAGLGALALLVTWNSLDAARMKCSVIGNVALLAVIFVLGCSIKETFYGWSLAIGLAIAASAALAWRSAKPAASRVALLLLPCVVIPLAHLLLRAGTGALGTGVFGSGGSRYQAEFGINLPVNAALLVAGSFANGPFHVVTDAAAFPLFRLLPLLACLFVAGTLIIASGLSWQRGAVRDGSLRRAWALAAISMASTAATLPAGSASELYCLGANVGTSILTGVSIAFLWSASMPDERLLSRIVAGTSLAVLLSIGSFGLAGRAYHHWITWQYARLTNDAILAHAASVEPVDSDSGRAAGVIYLSSPCILGRTYGQYVIPPAQAIGLDSTQPWLLKRDPTRPIVFSVNAPPGVLRPGDMVLDCSTMPKRASW